jgi:flagellar biosynthesis protein FlhG
VNDQAQRLRELSRERSSGEHERLKRGGACRSIAITGGKGGVGKSNISLFLALALSRLKKKVLLLDADLGLANIHILLGIAPRYNLSHMIRNECSVQDIMYNGPEGITILPGATGIDEMANLDGTRLESLMRALNEIENLFDYLLLDVGAGIGRTTTQVSAFADTALLILTPEPTSLADVYATIKMLVSHGSPRLSVMVNMAATEKEGLEIFDKLQGLVQNFLKIKLDFAGILPIDKDIPRLVRAQKNLLIEKPASAFSRRIQNCARMLCGMHVPLNDAGFFMRLFSANR